MMLISSNHVMDFCYSSIIFQAVRKYEKRRKSFLASSAETEKCKKTRQILDIWSSGFGVVCIQLYQHSLSVEALTREAAMIHALGKPNQYEICCLNSPARQISLSHETDMSSFIKAHSTAAVLLSLIGMQLLASSHSAIA